MPREAIKKLYYSIGEVSEATDLKQYVLRYWESDFPQLSPAKNRAGNRTYREKDIELVNFIKTLLYEKKYTIEGARQKLKELQDNGQPLNVLSLEEPVAAVPAPPVKPMEKPGTSKPVTSPQGNMSPENYKKFLTNLRNELKQLMELIDS
ncbi:MAG: MerR family transcriptional regulator [Candidatus Marinimicrobia bacterium]|nr:MerR family transcriptional regulator [Candidatus Neomarinimicrobiota bacterium]